MPDRAGAGSLDVMRRLRKNGGLMSSHGKELEHPCTFADGCHAVELIVTPHTKDIGDFAVRRALPTVRRRMVGPWVFFDHMGPAEFGEPLSKRYMEWNFVSSREERIAQAKRDWAEQRFPVVAGDERERIPLPG